MIDLNRVRNRFEEYTSGFDLENGKIRLKKTHTYGVVKMSAYIAKGLLLDEEDIKLAQLIAYLHDIARFVQAEKYNDFRDDKTMDHALVAVELLFNQNEIREYITSSQYDSIILKAIKNHNKFQIESSLSDKELLHCKIIRDADKLDNFRVKNTDDFESIQNSTMKKIENDSITRQVYQTFMNHSTILSTDRKTDLDCFVSHIAFIFDLNFNISLQYIKENNYINRLIDRIDYKNKEVKIQMENIRNHALRYLEERVVKQ